MSLDASQSDGHISQDQHPLLKGDSKKDDKPKLTHGSSENLLSSDDAEDALDKFEFPTAHMLVLTQMGIFSGYTAYVMTAWFDTALNHRILFPDCYQHWGFNSSVFGAWMANGCVASLVIYWTLPLFCCIVLLFFLYRDLLHTRIYYMMLAHCVHIDFMNIGFFEAVAVRIMIVWALLAVLVYPMAGLTGWRAMLHTIPYWVPMGSFAAMLYSSWDLERRLVSIAKFVENDVEWAGHHVKNAFFLRDWVAEKAFRRARKKLNQIKPPPKLSTGEYILELVRASEQLEKEFQEEKTSKTGELKQKKVHRKASFTIFHAVSPWYWCYQFLYSKFLNDERALKFHFWFRMYFWYSLFMLFLLLFILASTVLTIFQMQGILHFNVVGWIGFIAEEPKSSHDARGHSFYSGGHGSPDGSSNLSQAFNTLTSNFLQTGTGFMKHLFQTEHTETQAMEAEIGALQRQNAALVTQMRSCAHMLKAGIGCP